MAHQGKRLQELVKLKKLTQKEITEKMGYADRASFIRYYDKESLPQHFIKRVAEVLGIEESAFYETPIPPVQPVSVSADPSCWQLLAEARQQVIDLQQQIITMTMPNLNAPKAKQTV